MLQNTLTIDSKQYILHRYLSITHVHYEFNWLKSEQQQEQRFTRFGLRKSNSGLRIKVCNANTFFSDDVSAAILVDQNNP